MTRGSSLEPLHRQIMLSRTYRLAADGPEANLVIDPQNIWLWKFSRRRLEAEVLRDTMLSVRGRLDRRPGTAHPFPSCSTASFSRNSPFRADYDNDLRSVYLLTQRLFRHPVLGLFDAADANETLAQRKQSVLPTWALFLTNSPVVRALADAFAARLAKEAPRDDGAPRLRRVYLLAFARPP